MDQTEFFSIPCRVHEDDIAVDIVLDGHPWKHLDPPIEIDDPYVNNKDNNSIDWFKATFKGKLSK